MIDRDGYLAAITGLMCGPLREALGYTIESEIPYYRGIAGNVVNISMMWTRYTRFPILFIAFDRDHIDILADIEKQVQLSGSNSYFALLVVVPAASATGNEANELRRLVNNSVYRNDFVVLDQQHLASIIVRNSTDRLIEIILQQGIEISALSPYAGKGPVPANMFFGREEEIKTISQAIQQSNFALLGGRRIGKSSVLQRLDHILNRDKRYQAHYLNCEGVSEPAEFLFATISNLDDSTQTDSTGSVAVSHQFRQLVERTRARHNARQLVFLMDEVDQLLAFDAEGRFGGQLFKTFRALAHERKCSFVFSGGRSLHGAFHDADSPFFNFCQDLTLKPLAERSVAEIVSKPMHQLGIHLPDEEALIDQMIDITSCHPSLVQWLCDRLLRTTTTRRITAADLQNAASDHEFHVHFIETAWGDATPLERLVSVLPTEPSFTLDSLYPAASRHGLKNKSAIRAALNTLELFSLIQRNEKDYRFRLRQFPRIVREAEDLPALIEGWMSDMEV